MGYCPAAGVCAYCPNPALGNHYYGRLSTLPVGGMRNCWQAYKEDKYSMNDMWTVLLGFVAVISGLIAAVLWTDLIGFVLNPQWYTISTLVNLVK